MRHDLLHKAQSFFVGGIGVDQYFTDVLTQVVTDGADDNVAFLQQQARSRALVGGALDGVPQVNQIIQVSLQFFGAAANTGRADDNAHFVRYGHAFHGFTQFGALVAFDAAGDAAGTWIVWHQYQVAASQGYLSGQCGTFVATLFFVDLNDDFLAFAQHIFDVDAAWAWVFNKVFAGNFFQWQKAVTLSTEVDKRGFQAGFDAGDFTFIDIGLLLLAGAGLNIEVVEFLAIYKGYTQLFRLSCIDKHSFHAVR